MGVSKLLTFIINNQEKCSEKIDLIEQAGKRGGIELLCDLNNVVYWLYSNFVSFLESSTRNSWLGLIGAEYEDFNNYLERFVETFRSLNISLVFCIDGTFHEHESNLKKWESSFRKNVSQNRSWLRVLEEIEDGTSTLYKSQNTPKIFNVFLEVQYLETLRQLGCELIQPAFGEAEALLVKELQRRPKAIGIFSNDSDCSIFENSKFIPFDLFDVGKHLHLTDKNYLYKTNMKPNKLIVRVVSSEKVRQLLEVNFSNC